MEIKRELLKEALESVSTLDEFMEYIRRTQISSVREPFDRVYEAATRSIRKGRAWTDRKELRRRYEGRYYAMRRYHAGETLDTVFINFAGRVERYCKKYGAHPDVTLILEVLYEVQHERYAPESKRRCQ